MKIYVLTHKRFDPPKESIYVPLHVGRELSEDFGYLGDNTGENISDLNPLFGELTGIYWIWQNIKEEDEDYIGVCHYRRFYLNKNGDMANEVQLRDMLSEYDCITSDLITSPMTNYENYKNAHPHQALDEAIASLKRLYPDYSDACDAFMEDNKFCYSNLCVMPHKMYNEYCHWLFEILFDASGNIDVSTYDLYQKRVFGFLSEFLLDIYIRHHNYKVCRCPIGTFGDKAETMELIGAVSVLIKDGKFKEARKLVQDIIEIRPDILLPMSDSKQRVPIIDHITCILDLEQDGGYEGMISVSESLNELISYYRRVHDILSGEISNEDIEYLCKTKFSPYAALVMIKNDIGSAIRMDKIEENRVKSRLSMLFSENEMKILKQ